MSCKLELTLALFKPDVQRISSYRELAKKAILSSGFQIVAEKQVQMSRLSAEKFYEEHRDKFYYSRLVNYMMAGPIGANVLYGGNVITRWRKLLGPTKVYRGVHEDPNCLRSILGLTDTRNGFHGSGSTSYDSMNSLKWTSDVNYRNHLDNKYYITPLTEHLRITNKIINPFFRW